MRMQYLLDLLRTHGPFVILALAFLETLGLPVPAFPFLVIAGCLIVEGSLPWLPTLLAAVFGVVTADMIWYWMGRRLGKKTLRVLCKISLNPDSCVGRSEVIFLKHSSAAILTAKLFPGLNTLVPSLSGMLGLKPWRYAVLDAAGSLIWAGTGLGLGLAFGRGILARLESVHHTLLLLFAAMILFYILFRIGYPLYLTKRYSVPRIRAEELHQKLAADNGVVVVDLRNNTAYADSGIILPGSIRIPPADFEKHIQLLPRNQEIVFYCT